MQHPGLLSFLFKVEDAYEVVPRSRITRKRLPEFQVFADEDLACDDINIALTQMKPKTVIRLRLNPETATGKGVTAELLFASCEYFIYLFCIFLFPLKGD